MSPAPWERKDVIRGSSQTLSGQRVVLAEGKEGLRPGCECRWVMAIRVDLHEPVFGARPCKAHEHAARQALGVMMSMPPSDQDVGELYEELLEQRLR